MKTTANKLFGKALPDLLEANPELAKDFDAVLFFSITGAGGGDWTLDLVSNPPSCRAGQHGSPDLTVEISHTDFQAMLDKPSTGMSMFFEGKLKVTGNQDLFPKLAKLFAEEE